jgi:hypothetical protein
LGICGRRVNVVPPPNFMAFVVGRPLKTRKPVRDPWLLLGAAALILIGSGTALTTLKVHELWTRLLLTLIAAGCIAMVVFLYFASQRTERWQLEQNIERYRRG